MQLNALRNNRGIALLLTLAVTAIVVTATLEIHRKVRSAVVATAASRDRLALSQMAASGIHIAEALLVRDKMVSQADSIQEDWANPEKISELLQEMPFEEGKLTVAIEDEMGKLQINALVSSSGGRSMVEPQRMLWERLLNAYIPKHEEYTELEPATIIEALKDWMDSGDDDAITGLNGAESDYYEDLDPPYFCRNGPIKYKAELMRLKGMSPPLYFGIEDIPGISKLITVYGASNSASPTMMQWDGRININTAEPQVIAALLPLEAEDLVDAIIEYRMEKDGDNYVNDLTNPNWYKTVPGFSSININADLITVKSDIFRIRSTAELRGIQLTASAVVLRQQMKETGKWGCRMLSWNGETKK